MPHYVDKLAERIAIKTAAISPIYIHETAQNYTTFLMLSIPTDNSEENKRSARLHL